MKTKHIIEGLTILEKYRKWKDGYNTGAEHDQIFAYATDKPVEITDVARLIEIGWTQQEVDTGDDDFTPDHYNCDEGWSCNV